MRGDETERMARMRRWLDAVCAELKVDPTVLDASTDTLLDLIRQVAHGPSRPGAPMTAFLVGLSAGAAAHGTAESSAQAVAERVVAVERLVTAWPER